MRRLDLGSGDHPREGYEGSDVVWPNQVHHTFDFLAFPWPFDAATFGEIFASHVVEHVPAYLMRTFLREMFRVLAPGGKLLVRVPNGPVVCKAYLEHPDRRWLIHQLIFGHGKPETLRHFHLFDFALLAGYLAQAGFADVRDVTASEQDFHDKGWPWLGGPTSLKIEARKP